MTDSVFTNNTPETATEIGAVAFPGTQTPNTTNNVRETGSVGDPQGTTDDLVDFFGPSDPQGELALDPIDYFTFDPIDLLTVSVNFTPLALGEYINMVAVVPISGVSAVQGDVVTLSSGGDLTLRPELDYSFGDIQAELTNPAEFFLDNLQSPFLSGAVPPADFSEATLSVDAFPDASATWVLTGETVTFAVIGAELTEVENLDDEDDDPFGGGGVPTGDTFGDPEYRIDQVDYRIFLAPASGIPEEDPGTGTGGGGTGGGTGGGGTGGGQTPIGPVGGSAPAIPTVPTPAGGGGTQARDGQSLRDSLLQSEIFEGTGNFDVLKKIGPLSDFTFTWNADGSINLADQVFPDADDTLIGIERVELSDGTLALDVNGNAGQAYRLYQAAFARDPDIEGLIFWIDNIDKNSVDLIGAAEFFVTSEEFQSRYGAPETQSNSDFVEQLYLNVLGRVSDLAGFNFWTDVLDNAQLSRGAVLAEFSESVENQANLIGTIENGIWLPGYEMA